MEVWKVLGPIVCLILSFKYLTLLTTTWERNPTPASISTHITKPNESCGSSSSSPTPRPQCSLAAVRRYVAGCDFFPTAGSWTANFSLYRPSFCELPAEDNERFVRYVSTRASDVLVVGDSQAQRYFRALVRRYRASGYVCRVTAREADSFLPGTEFYTSSSGTHIHPQAIKASRRECHSCTSSIVQCVHSAHGANIVQLRYINLILTQTDVIQPNATYCRSHNTSDLVCNFKSAQEFVFGVYLRPRYPDVILSFATFVHDIGVPSFLTATASALRHTMDMMDKYIPAKTRVVWLTATTWNGLLPYFKDKLHRGHHQLADDKNYLPTESTRREQLNSNRRLLQCNKMLFDMIKAETLRNPKTNVFGFVDLFSVLLGRGRQGSWYEDALHLKPAWYDKVVDVLVRFLYTGDHEDH